MSCPNLQVMINMIHLYLLLDKNLDQKKEEQEKPKPETENSYSKMACNFFIKVGTGIANRLTGNEEVNKDLEKMCREVIDRINMIALRKYEYEEMVMLRNSKEEELKKVKENSVDQNTKEISQLTSELQALNEEVKKLNDLPEKLIELFYFLGQKSKEAQNLKSKILTYICIAKQSRCCDIFLMVLTYGLWEINKEQDSYQEAVKKEIELLTKSITEYEKGKSSSLEHTKGLQVDWFESKKLIAIEKLAFLGVKNYIIDAKSYKLIDHLFTIEQKEEQLKSENLGPFSIIRKYKSVCYPIPYGLQLEGFKALYQDKYQKILNIDFKTFEDYGLQGMDLINIMHTINNNISFNNISFENISSPEFNNSNNTSNYSQFTFLRQPLTYHQPTDRQGSSGIKPSQ